MPDPELTQALMQAHVRKMFFAFIFKDKDGKLIASSRNIPQKDIAEAIKRFGGGTAVTGTFFGPITGMVFQVAKVPPATLADMLKEVVKRDTGLTVVANVQLAPGDSSDDES